MNTGKILFNRLADGSDLAPDPAEPDVFKATKETFFSFTMRGGSSGSNVASLTLAIVPASFGAGNFSDQHIIYSDLIGPGRIFYFKNIHFQVGDRLAIDYSFFAGSPIISFIGEGIEFQ